MGLPFVKKQELYDFFQDYMNEIESGIRASTNYGKSAEKPLINKTQGLWSTTPNDLPETARSRVSDRDIDRHLTTCFTNGITSDQHLSGLKPPGVESDLPYMYDDPVAYNFFLFWLDQPQNEWLDAFLFEIADRWKELATAKKTNDDLLQLRGELMDFDYSQFDNINNRGTAKVFNEKDHKDFTDLVIKLRESVEVTKLISHQIQSLIVDNIVPATIQNEEAQMTKDFNRNGFLIKRVNENRKNIGMVRHALKKIGLDDGK